MGVPNIYEPVAIVLPSTTELVQLQAIEPDNNFADLTQFSAGGAYPPFTGSHSAMPALQASTTQIKDLLDEIDVEGVAADLSSGNLDIEYRRMLNRGSRYADAAEQHLRCRMTSNAFLSWESLSASQDQLAEIAFRILPVWDETNNPLIWASGTGITISATDAINALFTLGPIAINSTTPLDGVGSISWENNCQYREVKSEGSPFVKFAGIERVSPVLTIETTDRGIMEDFGAAGTALSSLQLFLRRKSPSGHNVANATAQHIKISATVGTIKPLSASGRLAIHLSGFTVNTASAIAFS